MTRHLLVVHGMGVHPPGWSSEVRVLLDRLAERYNAFAAGTPAFSAQVQIHEIVYDHVFREVVDGWRAEAAALEAFAIAAGRPLPRIIDWLHTSLADDDAASRRFFWSTAVDPLLYRGFALVRDRVRAEVTAQVVRRLTAILADGAAEVSLLAHSLGTAVTHDALHLLATQAWNGNESFTASRWKFANVVMLADVARLGPTALRDIDAYASPVRPVFPGGNDRSYCLRFLNVFHRWDPFVLCAPFRPTDWGEGYREVGSLDHIHRANLHGFGHYLDHPAVHIRLINGCLGHDAITPAEYHDALATYPRYGAPLCTAEMEMLRERVRTFTGANEDLETLIIRTAEFHAAAHRAATTCAGLGDA